MLSVCYQMTAQLVTGKTQQAFSRGRSWAAWVRGSWATAIHPAILAPPPIDHYRGTERLRSGARWHRVASRAVQLAIEAQRPSVDVFLGRGSAASCLLPAAHPPIESASQTAIPTATLHFAPEAHGNSQARGQIGAATAGLHHSCSNSGSEPHLQTTPQFAATPDLQPTEQDQGLNLHPHGY